MAATIHVGPHPQVAARPASDFGALRGIAVQAFIQDELRVQRADPFLDSDRIVVHAEVEPVDEAGRPHQTEGVGVGFFRSQVRVPPLQHVVLGSRRVGDIAELGGRDAAPGALFQGAARGRSAIGHGTAAGIFGHIEQVQALRSEPFPHVRSADRPLKTGPQLDAGIDGPSRTDAEGVGLQVEIVVGIAIAHVEPQFFRIRCALDQRDTGFEEKFRHVESPADRRGGAALAGPVAATVGFVGIESQVLFAVFTAEHHVHAGVGERRRDAVVAEMAGEVPGHHRLVGRSLGGQRQGQVIHHIRRHPALLKDVPGHAIRVGAIQHGPAHGVAGSRMFHHVQRAPDPGDRQVVQVGVLHVHLGVLIVQFVEPTVTQVAPQTEHAPMGGVAQVVLPAAALHVAPADVRRLHVVLRQTIGAAYRLELLRGQERIAAVQRIGVEKRPGRGDLGHRPVVHEHELAEGFDLVVHVIVRKQAGGPTPVGTLEIVRRRIVVQRAVTGHEPVALHLVIEALQPPGTQRAEVGEGPLR